MAQKLLRWSMVAFLMLFMLSVIDHTARADIKLPERNNKAVVDNANVFSPTAYTDLNRQLVQWHQKTHHDLVIATIPDLQGYPIEDFGYRLGRAWRLGRTGIDDAAILIYAKVDGRGKVRLEVARGFQPVLTDAMSKQIVHQVALAIKAKGPEAGLQLGANLVTAYINAHEDDVKKPSAAVPSSSSTWGIIVLIGFFSGIGMIVFGWIRHKKRQDLIAEQKRQEELEKKNSAYSIYGQSADRQRDDNIDAFQRSQSYSALAGAGAAASYYRPTSSAPTPSYTSSSSSDDYYRRSSSDDSIDTSFSTSSSSSSDDSFSSSNDDSTSFDGGGASEDC